MSRRSFLEAGASCAGWLMYSLAAAPASVRRAFAAERAGGVGRVVQREPWGRLEALGEGVWALISTPMADHPQARLTLCNGGIIAGDEGVLLIEAFASPEGARWLARAARRLVGRPVTHALITHYHGDHASGRAGYASVDDPRVLTTPVTRELLMESDARSRERGRDPGPLPEGAIPAAAEGWSLDLGGRVVRVTGRAGHTASDLTVDVDVPRVRFCGDLVWNGLFPNYMDATPRRLHRAVRALLDGDYDVYVPGHGALADAAGLRTYLALLEDVGAAARRAIDAGEPLDRAAARYAPPASLGEWIRFSDRYYEVAFRAWARDLADGTG